jgi:hypothetical protein
MTMTNAFSFGERRGRGECKATSKLTYDPHDCVMDTLAAMNLTGEVDCQVNRTKMIKGQMYD